MGLSHQPFWWELDDGEVALPERLGDAGYDTHLAGFQHVTDDPARLGFRQAGCAVLSCLTRKRGWWVQISQLTVNTCLPSLMMV